jgi:hypothetical protein
MMIYLARRNSAAEAIVFSFLLPVRHSSGELYSAMLAGSCIMLYLFN